VAYNIEDSKPEAIRKYPIFKPPLPTIAERLVRLHAMVEYVV
jgi:hypothetical protein